ncbi:MAG: hypothetical protein WCH20_00390 [Nitrospira sp.]
MNGRKILVSVWLGFLLLASGCVSSGNPSIVDQDRIAQIKFNISAKVHVRRALGKPSDIPRHSGSYSPLPVLPPSLSLTNIEVWHYTYSNVDVNAANFIVGLFTGGAPSNINTFTVVYDDQGIVPHIL